MTLYIITVTEKFQAAGECEGTLEIEAANKKEAISKARRKVAPNRSRYDGPVYYSAREWGE